MNKPLVTIGITSFNSADTIERAIISGLEQTWSPSEVVVVDDCSCDGTRELIEKLAHQYPKLRIFGNKVNGGVAVSRNRILAEARGEFVVFFDDDDVSLPNRIALQYARIVQYEQDFAVAAPVICHTARRVVYPHGETRVESTIGQTEGRPAPAGLDVARRILMGTPLDDGYGACPTCSQMARLSTYRHIGGFDPQLRRGEDTDFNIRLAEAGGHFVGIGKPLVTQTMTHTSEKSLAEEYRNMRNIMAKHRALMECAGQYEFCLRWLDAKQAWLTNRPVICVKELSLLALRHPYLTALRLALALPNIGLNRAFSRFHRHCNVSFKSRLADNES